MIISIEELRSFINTTKTNEELGAYLASLEFAIRKETNNKFQNRNIRFICNAKNEKLVITTPYLRVGDTIEISESIYNNGVYSIEDLTIEGLVLDRPLYEEEDLLITKIDYPYDVKMGVVDIMRWKLKNEDQNYNPDAEKDVQSETISRHSVTYAKDATESDIDGLLGVPRKYTSFLKRYKKARF